MFSGHIGSSYVRLRTSIRYRPANHHPTNFFQQRGLGGLDPRPQISRDAGVTHSILDKGPGKYKYIPLDGIEDVSSTTEFIICRLIEIM